MKIYIDNETKLSLEAKIAKIESREDSTNLMYIQEVRTLKEILSEAIVLPIEKSWKSTVEGDEDYEHYIDNMICFPTKYPNGVIIKS